MPSATLTPAEIDTQFRVLIGKITDYAIYTLDKDGLVTNWNSGAQLVKGYSTEEVLGRHYSMFFPPEDHINGTPQELLVKAMSEGRFIGEGWRLRKNSSRFWASFTLTSIHEENGEFAGFIKITRDLTEQRAAQEALLDSERQCRLLVDSLADCAIFTLDPSGHVTSWNKGAEQTTGYNREEILGSHYSIFFRSEDNSKGLVAQILATTISYGRFEDEGWAVRKDGTRFRVHVILETMRDHDGNFAGFAQVTRDITTKWALAQAKDQLHQAQKMETLGQLTGGVAHDFNNLLAAVIGGLELILKRSNEDNILHLAKVAHRAAERGGKLTHQLLSFAKKQVLQPQLSNINELIVTFDQLLKRVGGEAVGLQFLLDPELWLSDIDQSHFQSSLLNLVLNARDAMPKGGEIKIKTENVTIDSTSAKQLKEISPGNYVMVTVQDDGRGMSPEVKARAIEPFFTTKDIGQGSGLGLSQVYGFVRQSKGQINIKSEPGKGSSVSLYLPKAAEARMLEALPASFTGYYFKGTTLIVEDDCDARVIAVEAFESFGYTVYQARDGFEALSVLKQMAPINLLFTDIIMPNGINGVMLANDARRLQPQIRVLLASGYPRETLRANEGLNDSMAFIAKPYSFAALQEKLAALAPETVAVH